MILPPLRTDVLEPAENLSIFRGARTTSSAASNLHVQPERPTYGSVMYPPPEGPDLTEEQARELDDTFLASDPFQYFRSRIASLLTWYDAAPSEAALPPPEPGTSRAELNRYLQRSAADGPFEYLDVQAQVAADALAVRHHAAEALLRFAYARLTPSPGTGTHCLWAEVASGPQSISEVIKGLHEIAEGTDPSQRMLRVLVEPQDREATRSSPEVVDACNVLVDWLGYAAELLTPAEIDLQAAHNKVKHGLAVRSRADMRMVFTSTPPNSDGSIPVSALNGPGAVDIFDQPVLELLARPKVDNHDQGWEVSQLRLEPAALLADAYMLAAAHGVMFHVAAVEHFTGRDDLSEDTSPPPSPNHPVGGPRPGDIDARAPLGMRFPLTKPPGGGPNRREAGIGFRGYFQDLRFDDGGRSSGRVVEG